MVDESGSRDDVSAGEPTSTDPVESTPPAVGAATIAVGVDKAPAGGAGEWLQQFAWALEDGQLEQASFLFRWLMKSDEAWAQTQALELSLKRLGDVPDGRGAGAALVRIYHALGPFLPVPHPFHDLFLQRMASQLRVLTPGPTGMAAAAAIDRALELFRAPLGGLPGYQVAREQVREFQQESRRAMQAERERELEALLAAGDTQRALEVCRELVETYGSPLASGLMPVLLMQTGGGPRGADGRRGGAGRRAREWDWPELDAPSERGPRAESRAESRADPRQALRPESWVDPEPPRAAWSRAFDAAPASQALSLDDAHFVPPTDRRGEERDLERAALDLRGTSDRAGAEGARGTADTLGSGEFRAGPGPDALRTGERLSTTTADGLKTGERAVGQVAGAQQTGEVRPGKDATSTAETRVPTVPSEGRVDGDAPPIAELPRGHGSKDPADAGLDGQTLQAEARPVEEGLEHLPELSSLPPTEVGPPAYRPEERGREPPPRPRAFRRLVQVLALLALLALAGVVGWNLAKKSAVSPGPTPDDVNVPTPALSGQAPSPAAPVPAGPPGSLTLELSPDDRLELYIDGQLVPEGKVKQFAIPAGRHVVEIFRETYERYQGEVWANPGVETTVQIALERSPTLSLEITPAEGVDVRLNDRRIATQAPVNEYVLSPGPYRLDVIKPGYLPHQEQFTAVPGGTLKYEIKLQPRQ